MTTDAPSLDFSPERVLRIRISYGETQQEFADRLEVNVNMVQRWETGKSTPMRAHVLKALLKAEAQAEALSPWEPQ